MHVESLDLARRTRDLPNQRDRFVTRRATGAEDLDLSFRTHDQSP